MKKRTAKRPVQVMLYGFSGASLYTLEYFFNEKKSGKYKLVNDVHYADWCIFNADQPQTKEVLHKLFVRKINKPSIVISIKPLMWENTTTLLKPFTSQTLESSITEVELLVADAQKTATEEPSAEVETSKVISDTEEKTQDLSLSEGSDAADDKISNAINTPTQPSASTEAELSANAAPNVIAEDNASVNVAVADENAEKSSKVASLILAAQKRKARLAAEAKEQNAQQSTDSNAPKDPLPNPSGMATEASSLPRSSMLPDPRVGSVRAQVVARLSSPQSNVEAPAEALLANVPDSVEEVSVETDITPLQNETANGVPDEAIKASTDKKDTVVKPALTAEEKAKLRVKKAQIQKKIQRAKMQAEINSRAVDTHQTPSISKKSANLSVEPYLKEEKPLAKTAVKKPTEDANSRALNTQTLFGHLPNLDWTNVSDKRRMSLHLDGMLLPWLSKAVEQGKAKQSACKISGIHVHLEYLPWTDCFICDGDDDLLNAMMSSRFSVGELGIEEGTTTEAELFDGLGTEYRTVSSEDLLWLAGLWTSHGRVLPNDDPTRTRKLSYSPECARELQIPELHAILKIWQSRPMSAFQVIEALDMPQRYVFGVMAACTSAGLFKY
ncbi:hypothetical protein OW491_08390 [Neptunomonas sp. CHC150]|uniref:hypothetical protein n=1 Tax=Neptunomonas sp. CHC150 TaxID=2998324 RepID=UPI0025B0A883|nr:hypothetical protein [Neptunomonas sp. CHC150]MDN2659824.1 hypothetical protein [Neptunomonas sp. CHC150]